METPIWCLRSPTRRSLVLAPFLVVLFFPMAATHRGSPADLADSGCVLGDGTERI